MTTAAEALLPALEKAYCPDCDGRAFRCRASATDDDWALPGLQCLTCGLVIELDVHYYNEHDL